MELTKKYRMQILLPVILVAIVLFGSIFYHMFSDKNSSDYQCSLGEKYLNDLDYSGAILAYSNAITLDPTNTKARIGLSKAYNLSGETGFAVEILTESINDNRINPDIAEALAEIYIQNGDPGRAIKVFHDMLEQTDDEEYYERTAELLTVIYKKPYLISSGLNHQLKLDGTSVYALGQNFFGQLGIIKGVGDAAYHSGSFVSADFPEEANTVFCAGNTSYVIDKNNNLWAAGENRWGQKGLSYGSLSSVGGWTQIMDTGDVIYVSGSAGIVFVLKNDGTLLHSGAFASQKFEQCIGIPAVIKVAVTNGYVYALGVNGALYCSYLRDSLSWQRLTSVSHQVSDFAAIGSNYIWVDDKGAFGCNGGRVPDSWSYENDGSYKPDVYICELEMNYNNLVYRDINNTVYHLDYNGNNTVVSHAGKAVNMFTDAGTIYIVYDDGTVIYWDDSGSPEFKSLT